MFKNEESPSDMMWRILKVPGIYLISTGATFVLFAFFDAGRVVVKNSTPMLTASVLQQVAFIVFGGFLLLFITVSGYKLWREMGSEERNRITQLEKSLGLKP